MIKWSDPKTYYHPVFLHMMAGLLVVSILAPLFFYYEIVEFLLLAPLALAITREVVQLRRKNNTLDRMLDNISEWMFGAGIGLALIIASVVASVG